jgi:DNA polymerase I-like protein with 3'-5' exonuclease and polymerase domains
MTAAAPAIQELPYLVPHEMQPAMNPFLVVDGAGLDKMVSYLTRVATSAQPAFGLDTETDIQENFLEQRLRTIQVGAKDEQYVIDLLAFAETSENLKSLQGFRKTSKCFEPVVNALRPFLDSNSVLKIGHGLQFEYEMLSWNLGLYTWHLWCTLIVERVRWAGLQPFKRKGFWGMEHLVERYLKVRMSEESEQLQKSFDLCTPLTDEQVLYAAIDTRLPMGVYHGQKLVCASDRLLETAQIENDYIPANGDMHINGFKLDRDAWMKLVDEQTTRHTEHVRVMDTFFLPIVGKKNMPAENLLELEQKWRALSDRGEEEMSYHVMAKQYGQTPQEKKEWRLKRDALEDKRLLLKKQAGEEYKAASKYATWFKKEGDKMEGEACIVYASPAQLVAALQKMPGLENIEDTNDKTLSKLRSEFPVLVAVENYRSTGKAVSSFGENILEFINPITGRLHSRHDQLGAVTGRMTCQNPNLMQIPIDPRYRECFVAERRRKMATLDYDGCEVRIMTEASGDPVWTEALNNNWDIHSVVAEKMRTTDWVKATLEACAFVARHAKCDCPEHKHIRSESKSINFGLAYGLTAKGLADQLNITEERAQALLNLWHASNPVLSAALTLWGDLAKATCEARDLAGRRRLFRKPSWEWCKEIVTANNKKYKDSRNYGKPASEGQIKWKMKSMMESIAREGCNHKIQGTNASAIKLSMGCGYDSNGTPFFWHYSRPDKEQAFLCNLVHDEAVFESPDEKITEAYEVAKDCMIRALSRYVKKVPVTVDGTIDTHWVK